MLTLFLAIKICSKRKLSLFDSYKIFENMCLDNDGGPIKAHVHEHNQKMMCMHIYFLNTRCIAVCICKSVKVMDQTQYKLLDKS